MSRHVHLKSAAVGAALGVLFLLLAGAAQRKDDTDTPAIGRFQIGGTYTLCYVVDTSTGQVWASVDPGFKEPKLHAAAPTLTTELAGFLGRWVWEDATAADRDIQIEPDGRALATEENRHYEGRWYIEETHIVITISDEILVGELQPDGRMSLWEPGNDQQQQIVLRKVP